MFQSAKCNLSSAMRTISLQLTAPFTPKQMRARVEQAVTGAGLRIKSAGTLAKYRGCLHWHLIKPPATGTLELTYWPQTRQLWVAIHTNRQAAWIEPVLPVLIESLNLSSSNDNPQRSAL
jgi:hypothetical protein